MIKESILLQIAKRAGIDGSKFIEAVKAEDEKEFTVSGDGEFMTDEEIQALGQKGDKAKYEEGKKAGEEMTIKAAKKAFNVDFEGKTVDNLVSVVTEKLKKDAGIEPNSKIAELERDKESLQKQIDEKDAEIQSKSKELLTVVNEYEVKAKFPEKLENGLTREELYILYKSGREIKRTENGIELVDTKTGSVIKDKKLNPKKLEDDLSEFIEKFGKPAEPGRSGKDTPPKDTNDISSLRTHTDVLSYFEKNETPLHEQAGILQKAMKNEGFEMTK